MANPDWGTKRLCTKCSIKFYDLQQEPISCPKCATIYDPETRLKTNRNSKPAKLLMEEKANEMDAEDEAPEREDEEEDDEVEKSESDDDETLVEDFDQDDGSEMTDDIENKDGG